MKGKIDKKILDEINKIGSEEEKDIILDEDNFKKLENPSYDLDEEKEKFKRKLKETYDLIIHTLKTYCDWKENYYPIVACWIIGTYFHDQMITYPYLYFNASKQSGKSRSVRLITYLSKDGQMVNSMTEAVLFRTKGTIGVDEFERASRRGNENLLELFNSAYKKGVKVKRMRKSRNKKGEEIHVVEDFEVFRPIVLANIWGMDSVLEDRVLPMYLEKTTREEIGNLLEIWEFDKKLHSILGFLRAECSLCSVVTPQKTYIDWNKYLLNNYITTRTNNYTKLHLFKKIKNSGIKGRMLELSFPLLLIADEIDEKVLDLVTDSLKEINIEKNQEAFLEDKDILLTDMVSQEPTPAYYQSIKRLATKFKEFIQSEDDWINAKWIGRALKRSNLITKKKRTSRGIEVILDVEKAQKKIKMFK